MFLLAVAVLVNGGLCVDNHSHASSPLSPRPAGLEFPWGPKPFAEVVAGPLLRNNRQTTDSSTLEGSYVGVYFSAHWVSLICVWSVAIVWLQNCGEIGTDIVTSKILGWGPIVMAFLQTATVDHADRSPVMGEGVSVGTTVSFGFPTMGKLFHRHPVISPYKSHFLTLYTQAST